MSGGGAGASGGRAAHAGAGGDASSGATQGTPVLVFSRTLGYRHDAIARGVAALAELGEEHGFRVSHTEDAARFEDSALATFDVVVFLCTTGDVLNEDEQAAFQRFVQRGGGFVGVHSAADTEYDWPWYGELVGAYFQAHPPVQSARLWLENGDHPANAGLPESWVRSDEWYAFRTNPRPNVTVLLRLDESSYAPGHAGMGDDHPIAWAHEFEGGRAFYTALGHTRESYEEPAFRSHLASAIRWAARR